MRVILISENHRIAESLGHNLRPYGFAIRSASLADVEFGRIDYAQCEFIVLDVPLEGHEFIARCRSLAGRGQDAKLVVLAPASAADDVRELHPDEVMSKPFDFELLVARLNALARRAAVAGRRVVRYGDLQLDLGSRDAKFAGRSLELSAREFTILELLVRNPGRTLSRAAIGRLAWKAAHNPTRSVVDVYLSTLRRKLDDGGRLIHAARGGGYWFGAAGSRGDAA